MVKTDKGSSNTTLTPRQTETLSALRHYIETHDAAPTFSELSRILGFNCKDALVALRKRHLLTWGERKARSLTILNVNKVRKTLTRSSKEEETLPAPAIEVKKTSIQHLNHKTILSAEQHDPTHLTVRFTDGTGLRVEVQTSDEGPALALYLSTEVRLKQD